MENWNTWAGNGQSECAVARLERLGETRTVPVATNFANLGRGTTPTNTNLLPRMGKLHQSTALLKRAAKRSR